ncbi:MAG: sugar phosphate nucleotidyltransferase [Patescibacteria group bacterium]
MKGIILSGGSGTRLYPLTKVTSKQLLPVYDKPMINYPLQTLLSGGITDILIIVAPDHAGDYLKYLGSGKDFGARFTYEIQDKPEGLAQALLIAESFMDKEPVALILGDNIYEDDFSEIIKNFKSGAQIFVKEVHDPERFGVVKFDEQMNALEIVEKPKDFVSNYAQTGLYLYDHTVLEKAKSLKPSPRGELEITDLNNLFLKEGKLKVGIVKGEWIDAGTIDALYKANELIYKKNQKNQ